MREESALDMDDLEAVLEAEVEDPLPPEPEDDAPFPGILDFCMGTGEYVFVRELLCMKGRAATVGRVESICFLGML